MRIFILFFVFLFFKNTSNAQMVNGSDAPDWTLNDITGTSQNLYTHLNAGRPVIMDFSAAWCSNCWNYHNSHAVKDFYNAYGMSSGNYKANVFFIEASSSTTAGCLYGSSGGGTPFLPCSGGSMGNWTAGSPYPMIDNTALANTYQVGFYPTIYLVCPNKKVYFVGTQTKAGFEGQSQTLCGVSLNGTTAPLSYTNSAVDPTCHGSSNGSISIAVSGGTAPYSYAWSNAQTLSTAQNLVAGTYKCTVTDNAGAKLYTNNFTITQPNAINVSSVAKTHESCGVSGGIELNVSGGASGFAYKWSNNMTTKNLTNPSQSGIYTVTVTDSKNCTTTHSKDVIVHNFQPSVIVAAVPMLTCAASSVQLTATTPSVLPASSSIEWTTSNGIITAGYGTLQVSVTKAAAYSVKITDALSKCSATTNATVAANTTKPSIVFSPIEKITCVKKEVSITASNVNTYTYLWSNGTVLNAIKTSKSGVYTLSVTNNDNDCKAIFTTSAVEKDTIAPNFQLSVSNEIYCKKTNADIKGSLENGVTYLWNNGSANSTLTTASAGTYSATATSTANGCTAQKTAIVNEIKNPTLELASVVNASTGTKNDGEIHLTGKLGKSPYSYTWLANGKSIIGGADLTSLAGGVYNVTLTDVNACMVSIQKIVLKGAVQVADLEEVSVFNIYPNPISDKLNVTISLKKNQDVTLSIIDISGRVIAKKSILFSQNISEIFETQDLQKGVYFLQLQINGKIKAVELMKL
jgi:hypothetical protein